MRLLSLLFLISVFIASFAEAEENIFSAQRMITDFRGVVTNEDKTICYGDYGIMTFTTDNGKSWQQQSWGDKYNIMKMVSDGSEFYGVTGHFLFRTYENDTYFLKQQIFQEPNIVDMTLTGISIYILTSDGILYSDREMNINKSPIMQLDEESKYSEFCTDGDNLFFIKDDYLLMIYNIELQTPDSVDIIDQVNCFQCDKLSGLKVFDKELYIQISYEANDDNRYYSLLKSSDKGKNWSRITRPLMQRNCYNVINDEIFFLRPSSKNIVLNSEFSKLDSTHYEIDSSYFTVINKDDKPGLYIRYRSSINYKDFIWTDNGTIIAAGDYKLIAVSNDNGQSFEVKSFFAAIHYGNYFDNIHILNDSLFFVINGYEYNKTTNADITWLPQKYVDYNYTRYSQPYLYYIGNDGRGFATYKEINRYNDSSALLIKDYGENITKTDNKNLVIPVERFLYPKGFDLEDVILFTVNPETGEDGNDSYLTLRYDKTFRLLDSSRLSGRLINMVKIDDNTLISLNLITSGENDPDSTGKTDDYFYSYFLRKSTDKGKTWDSIEVETPFYQELLSFNQNYLYSDITHRNALLYENHIYYPTIDSVIYVYDIISNEFDSLDFPVRIDKYHPYALFYTKKYLFIISNHNNDIFYTGINETSGNWKKLSPLDIFGQWDNFNNDTVKAGKDAVIDVKMINDSTIYLITGKTIPSPFATNFEINFAKIHFDDVTGIEDSCIEKERSYLWNSNPYPIPARNIIRSKIYWNKSYDIEDAKIYVHNIKGTKLPGVDITIDKINSYSGILNLDCSTLISGTYIIQITLAGESISFPVLISK